MDSISAETIITIVLGLFGIFGTIFGVFHYFKNPQIDLEKNQALGDQQANNKAEVLAQQLQWTKEATDKRFAEMGANLDKALALALNHSHTVEIKVDALTSMFNAMNLETAKGMTELKTIIQERYQKT